MTLDAVPQQRTLHATKPATCKVLCSTQPPSQHNLHHNAALLHYKEEATKTVAMATTNAATKLGLLELAPPTICVAV